MSSRCRSLKKYLASATLLATSALGSIIVSYDGVPFLGGGSNMIQVDPFSGALTNLRPGAGIALSSGPSADTIIYSSGINTYESNIFSGEQINYAALTGIFVSPLDLARDSSTGLIYAIGSGENAPGLQLFQLIRTGSYYSSGVMYVQYQPIGLLGDQAITTIEYVPGVGMIGAAGDRLYTINLTSGATNFLVPTTIRVDALAYDPDSGRLLGVRSDVRSQIFTLTIGQSAATANVLNEVPFRMGGLATADIPEPATLGLTGAALAVIALSWLLSPAKQ